MSLFQDQSLRGDHPSSSTPSDLGQSRNAKDVSAEVIDPQLRDDARLTDLGYRPELRRNFSSLETFGVAFSIM